MPTYAVYEPPMRKRKSPDNADRLVFVRDGFSFGAFLFGGLWMMWRRLWLVLIIYVLAVAALEYGMRRLGVGIGARVLVQLLVALLIGMEAATFRRWALLRRGWRDCGVVIGNDRELAERRFFDARAARAATKPSPMEPIHGPIPPSGPGVVGLFPEPGG
jgi:hypothetical protein